MSKYFFVGSVLKSLSRGKILNNAIAIILWIVAIILGLACLVGWIMAWRVIFKAGGSAILGGIVFQLFFVVMSYMLIHVIMIRATDIRKMPESDFVAVPIISILFKLIAELYASLAVPLGIGGGIAMWFEAENLGSFFRSAEGLIPSFGSGSGFVGGTLFILSGILSAILVLVFFYYMSEMIYVFIEIEKNTRSLRQGALPKKPEDGTAKCPNCGATVKEGDSFCEKCGAKLSD